MKLTDAVERLETVVGTTGSPDADTAAIAAALSASSALKSFLTAQDAELARMLAAQPGSFPEATIADATRCSLNDASRTTGRASTLDSADAMADALADGDIFPGHVDALTRASRQLDDEQRAELFDQHEELAAKAADTTIGEFSKLLKRKVKDLRRESGEEHLARQRRDTRLRTWTDGDDMFHLAGKFDPATGSELAHRIREAAAQIKALGVPDTAPTDSAELHEHLEALALAGLVMRPTVATESHLPGVSGDGEPVPVFAGVAPISLPERSRRDAVIIVDATHTDPAGEPRIDHGIPAELPFSILRDLFDIETPDVVVVANGIVLHAPGNLNLGRSTRLANRPQRRALRGLYATCAVPGCTVHYDRCKLHHIVWWRNDGRTDLDNLIPVCQHHHTRIHEDLWQITLGPNRELAITMPNGQVMRTGPPRRSAA